MTEERKEEAGAWLAYWRDNPVEQPRMLLEMFSIDPDSRGALIWAALTFATAMGEPQPRMIARLCDAGRLPRPRVYQLMNQAMAPALEGPQQIMETLGLHECERASELARAVARNMRACGYKAQGEEVLSDWLKMLKRG